MTREQAIECMARAMMPTVWGEFDPKIHATPPAQRAAQANCTRLAAAALDAYHAHLTASGMAIVPVEPTEVMLDAGAKTYGDAFYVKPYDASNIYRAMITAAQGEA